MIIKPSNRLKEVKEYYFSKKLAEVRQMQVEGANILNLGIGNPDQMPSAAVIDKLKVLSTQPDVHGYQPYKGLAELRQGIADFCSNKYSVVVDPETEVLPLIGSKEGITHVSLAFLNKGDKVLIPELAYPAYEAVANMVEAEAVRFPLREDSNWEPDWEFLESLDYTDIKILWLNYPHMPTGAAANRSLFKKYVKLAHDKEILICHDNPYSLILNKDKPLSILDIEGAKEVAIELNSMSKSHNMAGWRIGWVIGAQDYINTILRIKSNVDSGTFKPMQLAAVEGLKLDDSWSKALNKRYSQRKALVENILDTLNCSYAKDQEGLFVWAKVGDNFGYSSTQLADHLLYNHHIFVTPGFIFGKKGDAYIRIALCSKMEDYEEAIRRLNRLI